MIYRRVSSICALLTGALGMLTLIGWMTGMEVLASLRRNLFPMAPSSALAFTILAIVMMVRNRTFFRRHPVPELLVLMVAAVACGKVWEFFSGGSIHLDEWLVSDPAVIGSVEKRQMSPITALNLLLLCVAINGLLHRRLRVWAGRFAMLVLAIALVVMLGYLYGTPFLYGGSIKPVSFSSAIATILLATSVIAALGPQVWPLKPLTGDATRAVLLRWFLPASVGVALAEGFLRTKILIHWHINPALTSALSTLLYTVIVTAVISQVARLVGGRIDRAEQERNAAQAELEALNRDLERRIAERTRELSARNEQMEEELTMARELQFALLPDHFPSVPRSAPVSESALQFFSIYYPAGVVSGDFFSVFPVSESSVGIFICDVMGHGVRAALVTSMMRALLEQHSGIESDPGRLLEQVNKGLNAILKNTGTTMYATAVMMIADAAQAELLYANAGHPKPLHIRRQDGETVPLEVRGKRGALGLFPEANFATTRTTIAPGDLIMLFTDGLFEVESTEGQFYSHEELLEAVRKRSELPATELFDQVIAEIRSFARRSEFDDDVCIIGIEVARFIDPATESRRVSTPQMNAPSA